MLKLLVSFMYSGTSKIISSAKRHKIFNTCFFPLMSSKNRGNFYELMMQANDFNYFIYKVGE